MLVGEVPAFDAGFSCELGHAQPSLGLLRGAVQEPVHGCEDRGPARVVVGGCGAGHEAAGSFPCAWASRTARSRPGSCCSRACRIGGLSGSATTSSSSLTLRRIAMALRSVRARLGQRGWRGGRQGGPGAGRLVRRLALRAPRRRRRAARSARVGRGRPTAPRGRGPGPTSAPASRPLPLEAGQSGRCAGIGSPRTSAMPWNAPSPGYRRNSGPGWRQRARRRLRQSRRRP